MTHKKDRTIEEAINDGDLDLMKDYVVDNKGDMWNRLRSSPLRRQMYLNEKPGMGKRIAEICGVSRPGTMIDTTPSSDYAIQRIPGWQYDEEIGHGHRVLALKDQGLEIDIKETIKALSATACPEMFEPGLRRENENAHNEVILQKLYRNIQNGQKMFEGFDCVPLRYKPTEEKEKGELK